jgi:hypothetical protein
VWDFSSEISYFTGLGTLVAGIALHASPAHPFTTQTRIDPVSGLSFSGLAVSSNGQHLPFWSTTNEIWILGFATPASALKQQQWLTGLSREFMRRSYNVVMAADYTPGAVGGLPEDEADGIMVLPQLTSQPGAMPEPPSRGLGGFTLPEGAEDNGDVDGGVPKLAARIRPDDQNRTATISPGDRPRPGDDDDYEQFRRWRATQQNSTQQGGMPAPRPVQPAAGDNEVFLDAETENLPAPSTPTVAQATAPTNEFNEPQPTDVSRLNSMLGGLRFASMLERGLNSNEITSAERFINNDSDRPEVYAQVQRNATLLQEPAYTDIAEVLAQLSGSVPALGNLRAPRSIPARLWQAAMLLTALEGRRGASVSRP